MCQLAYIHTQEKPFFFFLITVDVRASLRAPRLIPRGPEVNDRVNLQWP